jgi:hypothetical protein
MNADLDDALIAGLAQQPRDHRARVVRLAGDLFLVQPMDKIQLGDLGEHRKSALRHSMRRGHSSGDTEA